MSVPLPPNILSLLGGANSAALAASNGCTAAVSAAAAGNSVAVTSRGLGLMDDSSGGGGGSGAIPGIGGRTGHVGSISLDSTGGNAMLSELASSALDE